MPVEAAIARRWESRVMSASAHRYAAGVPVRDVAAIVGVDEVEAGGSPADRALRNKAELL